MENKLEGEVKRSEKEGDKMKHEGKWQMVVGMNGKKLLVEQMPTGCIHYVLEVE